MNEHEQGYVRLCALIDGKKVVVSEAIIRRDLHLDDADGVKYLPNDESFEELSRMGYEKPPPKLTFYKAFFSAQWKFLMRVRKGFSGVETPLFDSTLVQPQPQAKEGVEIPIAPEPPSTTTEEESKEDRKEKEFKAFKVKKAEKGWYSSKSRIQYCYCFGCSGRYIQTGEKIAAIDVDEGITLVDVETDEKVVAMDAESQGRLNQKDVNAASKGVSVVSATD
nr:hypothetical protein [Tanacetum cinerariifolium]